MVESTSQDTCVSWCYLAIVSVVTFFIGGFLDAYGVLMVFLVEHYNGSNAKAAWVGSLTFFCTYSLFPVTLRITNKFNSRKILLFAAVLTGGTFLITPYILSINYLFLTFSIPFGVTCSILESIIITTIFDYFKTSRGMAFGLRIGAGNLGTMMYSFLLPVLMAELGWTWTFKALAGMSVVCLVFACVHKRWKNDSNIVKSSLNSIQVVSGQQLNESIDFCIFSKYLRNKRFLIFLSATTAFYSVALMPSMFLVRFATLIDIPVSKASWLMVCRSIISTVTKCTAGRFGDFLFKHKKIAHVLFIGMILHSLSTFLCSFTTSFSLLMSYMCFVSVLDSIHWTLLPLFVTEITGDVNSYQEFALVTCFGAFSLLAGPPLLGMLYDKTGNFSAVFYMTSVVLAVAAGFMAFGIAISPNTQYKENINQEGQEMQQNMLVYNDKRRFFEEQYITTV